MRSLQYENSVTDSKKKGEDDTLGLRKTSKRILVVDDESDVCFVIERVLGEHGFEVKSYRDPLLALAKFKAQSYDLVILDIKMPDLKKVKVCFLTAGEMYYGVYSDIFSSLPASCFIQKPIDNEELLRRINEIVVDGMDSKHSTRWS